MILVNSYPVNKSSISSSHKKQFFYLEKNFFFFVDFFLDYFFVEVFYGCMQSFKEQKKLFAAILIPTLYLIIHFSSCQTYTNKNIIDQIKTITESITESKIKSKDCLNEEYFILNQKHCFNQMVNLYRLVEDLEEKVLHLLENLNELKVENYRLNQQNKVLLDSVEVLEKERDGLNEKLSGLIEENKNLSEELKQKRLELESKKPKFITCIKLALLFFILGFLSRFIAKFLFQIIKSKLSPI